MTPDRDVLRNVTCSGCGDLIKIYTGSPDIIECLSCSGALYRARVGVGNSRPSVPIADIQYKGIGPFTKKFSDKHE
jgi:ribosomal protein S27E